MSAFDTSGTESHFSTKCCRYFGISHYLLNIKKSLEVSPCPFALRLWKLLSVSSTPHGRVDRGENT